MLKKTLLTLTLLTLSASAFAGVISDRPAPREVRGRGYNEGFSGPVQNNIVRCHLRGEELMHVINTVSAVDSGQKIDHSYEQCAEADGLKGIYGCGFGEATTYAWHVNGTKSGNIDSVTEEDNYTLVSFTINPQRRRFIVHGKRDKKIFSKKSTLPRLKIEAAFTGHNSLTVLNASAQFKGDTIDHIEDSVSCNVESTTKFSASLN